MKISKGSVSAFLAFGVSVVLADTKLYYDFDAVASKPGVLDPLTTSVTDSSGNGYHGILMPVATARTQDQWDSVKDIPPSFVEQAHLTVFDPVTSVRRPNPGSLDFAATTGSGNTYGAAVSAQGLEDLMLQTFTVEFFMNTSDGNDSQRDFFVIGTQLSHATFEFGVSSWSQLAVTAYVTDGMELRKDQSITSDTIPALNDGRWHHIAATLDGATHGLKVYVDYKLVLDAALDGSLYYYPNRSDTWNLRAGAGGNSTKGYRGRMDEFRVSDTVLDEVQFLRLEKDPEVVLHYTFDSPRTDWTISQDSIVSNLAADCFHGVMKPVCSALSDWDPVKDVLPEFSHLPYVVTDPKSGDREDGGCFNFAPGVDPNAKPYGAAVAAQAADALMLQTFTVEFFVNTRDPSTWDRNFFVIGTHNSQSTFELIENAGLKYFTINAYVTDEAGERQVQTLTTETLPTFNDGKWHHVAVALDESTHMVKIYLDYEPVYAGILNGSLYYYPNRSDTWNLRVGAGGNSIKGYSGLLDEFRVTDSVIQPEGFLSLKRKEKAECEVLFYADFDTDMRDSLYPGLNGRGVVKQTASASAEIVPDVWKVRVCEREGDVTIRERNAGSLQTSGGGVRWGRLPLVEAEESFTVEFFLKKSDVKAEDCLIGYSRVSESSEDQYGRGFHQSAWQIGTRHDVPDQYNQLAIVYNWGTTLAYGERTEVCCRDTEKAFDGRWHHIAVTFEPCPTADGSAPVNTLVNVYLDGSNVKSAEANGRIRYDGNPNDVGLRIDDLRGQIDELRISRGVLPVGKFLRARNEDGGMLILLR